MQHPSTRLRHFVEAEVQVIHLMPRLYIGRKSKYMYTAHNKWRELNRLEHDTPIGHVARHVFAPAPSIKLTILNEAVTLPRSYRSHEHEKVGLTSKQYYFKHDKAKQFLMDERCRFAA